MLDLLSDNPVAGFIVACEIGLWVLLGAGLALRYLLRWRFASTLTLAAIPLLDVLLVGAVAVDLHRGAEAGGTHTLAGLYLGFSVAFGPALVRWADVRFAHRFAGGPAPVKPPRHGPAKLAALWREWFRVVAAATIASVVLLGLVLLVADPAQDEALLAGLGRPWVVVGLWLLLGPLWELPSARQGRDEKASARSSA